MTDNKTTSSNISVESTKQDGETENSSVSAASKAAKPDTKKNSSIMKKSAVEMKSANHDEKPKTKISKLALLSLILVIIAIAAIVGNYLQTKQQLAQLKNELTSELATRNQQAITATYTKITQQLNETQHAIDTKTNTQLAAIRQENQSKFSQFEQVVSRFNQSQPSDWLIHEAEYLIRIAARSVWLNNDTNVAINLLGEADERFKQLNNPQFLAIRQLIRQDIATLNAMPTLAVEDSVLALMALNSQIEKLPLAFVDKEALVVEKSEPTADIADWQANLKITWNNFVDDYFTLRPINANIQPLLNPEQQQNLRQNLSLKIQLAIWAATEHKTSLYQQAIADIKLWLNQYFDMEQHINSQFEQDLLKLNESVIYFDYSVELSSLNAVRKFLAPKPLESLNQPTTPAQEIPQTLEDEATKELSPEEHKNKEANATEKEDMA